MKEVFCFLLFGFSFFTVRAQERPKLVVGIVVDQMRWDYLYRFYDRFSENGFKRLLNNGFECKQTQIHYIPSYTAPGHASIYTGSSPAFHGIVGNDWVDKHSGKTKYCTEDKTSSTVGSSPTPKGAMSPKNMMATTVTDELRMATNFKSRVFAISLKDRGSILPGGHTANAAFWFDNKEGVFISSTYYLPTLPQWLQDFNRSKVSDSLLALNWNSLYPLPTYWRSDADENEYEGLAKGEKKPVFPHLGYNNREFSELAYRPAGNTYTLLAAQALLKGEELGKGQFTDFLCISFSATDYIGHRYAPNSIEVEDTYLRLDLLLGEFLETLDKKVGVGNYTLFLTADHGGAHNARWMNDKKMMISSTFGKEMMAEINKKLNKEFNDDSLISFVMNDQIYLNHKRIAEKDKNMEAVKENILKSLRNNDAINFAFDLTANCNHQLPKPLSEMVINGYHPQRSGDIQYIPHAGYFEGYAPTGTSHGGWNLYDTRIPLIFYGWGIAPGHTHEPVFMNDIAPTMAALLHVQNPNACTGKVVEAALKN